MRNYEGDLTIDSTSFWAFVEENLFDLDGTALINAVNPMGGFGAPSWNASGELEIPHEEGETLYIDGVVFWCWIIKDFCPNQDGDEYAFDQPKYDADMETIYIKFAASNECHPSDWFTKPEWMENTK